MIERTETRILLEQTLAAPAAALFAVLSDPRRHVEIDGSGMLQGPVTTEPLTAVDQVFVMAMHNRWNGDYRTENRVTEFVPDRRIAWATAKQGQPPAGVVWGWSFDPQADGRTRVSHSYDWSAVTDPAVLARVEFPRVQPDELRETMRALATAAGAT